MLRNVFDKVVMHSISKRVCCVTYMINLPSEWTINSLVRFNFVQTTRRFAIFAWRRNEGLRFVVSFVADCGVSPTIWITFGVNINHSADCRDEDRLICLICNECRTMKDTSIGTNEMTWQTLVFDCEFHVSL